MKKTLIALAAMVATSAAFAQSSVTLSGAVDPSIERVKQTNGKRITSMSDARNSNSQWTLSGTEDLGGGLRANFKISTAFRADSGTASSLSLGGDSGFGNNDMFVELAGGFGSVKLGRSFNPVFSHALTANSTKGVSGFAAVGNTLDSMNVYVPNQLLYTTPRVAGFTGQVSYAPSEEDGAKAHSAFGLRYVNGPLVATLSTGNEFVRGQRPPEFARSGEQLTSGAFKQKRVSQVAAAYDFGIARPMFTYQSNANLAEDRKTAYVLAVTVPVGPALLWAQYGLAKAPGNDSKVASAGVKYSLSKRTLAYVQYGKRNASPAGFTTANPIGTDGFGLGLQHSF